MDDVKLNSGSDEGFLVPMGYFCYNRSLEKLVRFTAIGHWFVHSLSRNSVWNNAHFWWSFTLATG